jgi:hypothetical protein
MGALGTSGTERGRKRQVIGHTNINSAIDFQQGRWGGGGFTPFALLYSQSNQEFHIVSGGWRDGSLSQIAGEFLDDKPSTAGASSGKGGLTKPKKKPRPDITRYNVCPGPGARAHANRLFFFFLNYFLSLISTR